jgi:hypothetical protein
MIVFFQLAQRNKEDGNTAFQAGNHEMAILVKILQKNLRQRRCDKIS